ncbi:MAG: hypothetical protein R2699_15665 [Acidimicrobiales bacterium]
MPPTVRAMPTAGEDDAALFVTQHPGERRVLTELSAVQISGCVGLQELVDRPVEQLAPLVEPTARSAANLGAHASNVLARACKGSVGVGHDAARDRVGEPQAAALVGGETFGPLADRLDVTSADPAVGANRCVGQKTSFTQVDDVLARRRSFAASPVVSCRPDRWMSQR